MSSLHCPARVYLARHGEATYETGVSDGDGQLTPHGRAQARRLAELLRGERIARVWTSPLARAVQTAEIVAGRLDVDVVVASLGSVRNIECLDGAELAAGFWGVACDAGCRAFDINGVVTDSIFVAGDLAREVAHHLGRAAPRKEHQRLQGDGGHGAGLPRGALVQAGWARRAGDPAVHADLLLLDANPLQDVRNVWRQAGVMVRGEWLPQAQIDRRLDEIAAAVAR